MTSPFAGATPHNTPIRCVPSRALDVQEASHVAEVRRVAAAAAADLGEARASDVSIAATELATNLLKHAGGGKVIVQTGRRGGVELLSLDRGPGIVNLHEAMRDGFSTAGSPGNGLGAVARLANALEVHTQPGHGSVIFAQFSGDSRRASAGAPSTPGRGGVESGSLCVPLRGEIACGDGFSMQEGPEGWRVLIVDGLGHGPLAAEAAHAAVRVFHERRAEGITTLVGDIHAALRSTRGAAVAIAHINSHQGTVRYCGVGNTSGAVVSPDGVRRMVSHNGTAGLGSPRLAEFSYPWQPASLLLMHTDGVSAKWDFAAYPGLANRHPGLIAGVLFRDFARERDDATLLVVREVSS